MEIRFQDPYLLLFLAVIPFFIYWKFFRLKKKKGLLYSNTDLFPSRFINRGLYWNYISPILKITAYTLLVIALARPQLGKTKRNIYKDGINIVICLDTSTSMLAQDFKPDRLQAAKKITEDFVGERVDDNIGLVVFAGEAFTQVPLTIDHEIYKNFLSKIETMMVEDGTAIGTALGTAVNRLKDVEGKSKIIILLTDGDNNRGSLAPETAADIAAEFGIKIYTIGVGTEGTAPFPVRTVLGGTRLQYIPVKINEELLQYIAQKTNGKYFRAKNNEALENIYKEINQLEKIKIQAQKYVEYFDLFVYIILAGLGFYLLEFILTYLIFPKLC